MHNDQRFRLHFGPYRTPRFKYGQVVWCEVRGWMRITGITNAPIPWPVGRPVDMPRGKATPILYKRLVRAVQRESNQAVAHWWGVSGQTVTKWKKAVRAPTTTEGTSRLRAAHAREEPISRGRLKAHEKARNPILDAERRAKIAAAKQGRKRPPHVREKLLLAHLGRPLPPATRRKMSEAHRKRGTRPPWLNPPWTAEELELLRTLPPGEVARKSGRSLSAVYSQRGKLGINDGRTTRHGTR